MRILTTVALASLVALLLAAGCGPTPTPTPPGERLEWEEIAQAKWARFDDEYKGEPRIEVITNQQEAAVLEGQVYPHILSQVLSVDFSTYFVIAVFQGYKGCANYSVEVTDVHREGKVIAVYAKFLTPDPGEVRQPIATSPYYVLKIEKVSSLRGDFVFILVANGEEIMRQQHSIP